MSVIGVKERVREIIEQLFSTNAPIILKAYFYLYVFGFLKKPKYLHGFEPKCIQFFLAVYSKFNYIFLVRNFGS